MTVHQTPTPVHLPRRVAPVGRDGAVRVHEAATLADFMLATPVLRRLARETAAPTPPDRVGTLLARFNFGAGGREVGTLLLARDGAELVGFAVLRARRSGGLDLVWLHAEPHPRVDVAEALWDEVSRLAVDWAADAVHVGYHAGGPTAELAAHLR